MVDPLNVLEYNLQVSLELKNPGQDISARLEFLRKKFKDLLRDSGKLKKAFGGDVKDGIDKMADSMDGFGDSTKKETDKAASGMKSLGSSINTALRTLGRLTTGFGGAGAAILALTRVSIGLEQGFMKTSAGVNRLGIGMTELEGSLKSVANQISLTIAATTALFDAYQMDMRFVSLEGFESMMERIQQTVGPNEQAMQQMASVITGLSGDFPELARQMENVTDANRGFLLDSTRQLELIGARDTAQARMMRAYVLGNSQMSEADKKRYDESQKQQKAMKEISRAFESLAITAGTMVLPHIVKITEWLEKMQDSTSGWYKFLEKIAAVLLVIKASSMAISFGGIASGAMGMLGGTAAGGAVTAAGGGAMAAAGAGFVAILPVALAAAAVVAGIAIVAKKSYDIVKVFKDGGGALSGGKGFENIEKRLAEQERQKAAGTFVPKSELNVKKRAEEEEKRILKEKEKIQKDITDAQVAQKQLAEAVGSLYQQQSSYLDAVVTKMRLSGKVNKNEILANTKANVAVLKQESAELDEVIASLAMKAKNAKEAGKEEIFIATLQAEMTKHKERQQMIEADLVKEYKKGTGVYDERIKAMSLETDRANKLIEIADNYAIGIGASAKMRMDSYAAEGQRIDELKNKLGLIADKYNQAVAANDQVALLSLANERKQVENEILDATLKQNQAVKAMRDGWVSAISAMQTGAGGFSEIIMDAEKNTAQIQRLEGAVRTSMSGAFARGGGDDVGFRRSERFGVGGVGSITGRQGGRQLSYLTQADKRMGIGLQGPSVLQYGARGAAQRTFNEMRTQGRTATGGGGQALGAGNAMLLGSYAAGPGNVDANVSMNGVTVNISVENVEGLNNIEQRIGNAVGGRIANAIISGAGNR